MEPGSRPQHAASTSRFNFFLGHLGEILGSDNDRLLGQASLAENLVIALQDKTMWLETNNGLIFV
jgi:hypothetical protein